MRKLIFAVVAILSLSGCKARGEGAARSADEQTQTGEVSNMVFDADSCYEYVGRQVAFGPRVPNSEAHRLCGDWLVAELRRHGAEVLEQTAVLEAFDGSKLNARNILGKYNPAAKERVLLVAHWDCRPWADADPDEANHGKPVDGANDGASGVGVLLEIARQLKDSNPARGVDILFVDAEDYGSRNDDDSWALGARYFVEHMPGDYVPSEVVLLDMVGGANARFHREYFSQENAPELADAVWSMAAASGFGEYFPNAAGGGVTDDHLQFINHGIPAIDIIEFNPATQSGFNPRWHTVNDTMEGIDRRTLKAVGQTVLNYVSR